MRQINKTVLIVGILLLAVSVRAQAGEQGLVSTMSLMNAVEQSNGITIVPAADVPAKVYTEDHGPSQVLEIIRPDMGPVSIGRLNTSCTCIQASLPKKDYAQGERILLELRNVKATPPAGATYAIFVQLTSPVKEVLQHEIFVKSTQKPGQKPAAAASNPPPAAVPSAAPAAGAPGNPYTPTTTLKGANERGVLVVPTPVQAYPSRPGRPPIKYEDITPYPSRNKGN